MADVHESTDQLLEAFAQPTAEVRPGRSSIQFIDDDEAQEGTPAGPPPADPVELRPEPPAPAPEPEPPAPAEARTDLLSPEATADLFIGGVDFLQTQVFTKIMQAKIRKRMGGREDHDRIMTLLDELEEGHQQLMNLEISDRAKVRLMKRAVQKIDELPFTDKEFDQIQQALVIIIRDMPGYRLPASYGLALAFGQVLVPRFIDVVTD